MWVRSVERVDVLERKYEELDGTLKTRGVRGTTWLLFINQLRPREDCSFPKDC